MVLDGHFFQQLVTDEDLEGMSTRQINMMRRQKRANKRKADDTADKSAKADTLNAFSKRVKLELYSPPDEEGEETSSSEWVLEGFCDCLFTDLAHPAWEHRHGAATALRDVLTHYGGRDVEWIEDAAARFLAIVGCDKFGDFVSDQVVAPVRETAAMALGAAAKRLPDDQVVAVTGALVGMIDKEDDWQCRHGGLLGLKHLLARKNSLLSSSLAAINRGLQDDVDDVVGAAASALVPVAKFLEEKDAGCLVQRLWETLQNLDELSSSTSPVLQLLSTLIELNPGSSSGFQPLSSLVPRLVPFLHHASSTVRLSALQTVHVLTSRPHIARTFLHVNCSELLQSLFERAVLEHQSKHLQLIESIWCSVCDNTPLQPLLLSTCPLYGHWLLMIMNSPALPLSLLVTPRYKSGGPMHFGGPEAAQETDFSKRQMLMMRARCLGCKLLGKLACFIVQPVPGMDYSKDVLTPVGMLVEKILLPNLDTNSTYHRLTIGLVLRYWLDWHPEKSDIPLCLSAKLTEHLTRVVNFDETRGEHYQLQKDAVKLLQDLKSARCEMPAAADLTPMQMTLSQIEVLADVPIKNEAIQTFQKRIKDSAKELRQLQVTLTTLSSAAVAAAVVRLDTHTEKLTPVIKPIMESVKTEKMLQLQEFSAQILPQLLKVCLSKNLENVVEKIVKNLICFASSDPKKTPRVSKDGQPQLGIVSLDKMENPEDEAPEDVAVLTRGASLALQQIIREFGAELSAKMPTLWQMAVANFVQPDESLSDQDVVFCLQTLEVVSGHVPPEMRSSLEATLPRLSQLVSHPVVGMRHMAARCLAKLATVAPSATITAVLNRVLPLLDDAENVHHRQGAVEALFSITEELKLDVMPYIVLFVVPVLGRISDQDASVRVLANKTFATHVKLIPLEQKARLSVDLSPELLARREKDRKFVDELLSLQNIDDFELPIHIKADLRSYQKEGIKWLAFLNRYRLHGVLCDDMGLGKTLQTIAMVASDHHRRHADGDAVLPSLVVCPATLVAHWKYEIEKFVDSRDLTPVMFSSSARGRVEEAAAKNPSLVVVSSYENTRNYAPFFRQFAWNYLVLDEGHVIRNSKSKTTQAIKTLKANKRLILSGTPIQNSVLELWSLFDFLMPGFLGSERSFNAAFSRPILASRVHAKDPAMREKGALAVESLHRQVLPFILRRVKDQVLDDLPPKIIQDVQCDLSPLQVQLYEAFSKKQKLEDGDDEEKDKVHVFQSLQYLRKVCNHPKLVNDDQHPPSTLKDISYSGKLVALKELLLQCGIGDVKDDYDDAIVSQHRVLIFFQLKSMMDIVVEDLLKPVMPSVTYIRMDGSTPANARQDMVQKFNRDPSIDIMLLSTAVGKW